MSSSSSFRLTFLSEEVEEVEDHGRGRREGGRSTSGRSSNSNSAETEKTQRGSR
jgi:hypothetical protein